jgi:O-antigen/teichoic acid export membrane protein
MTRPHKLVWNTGLALAFNLVMRAAGALTFIAIARLGSPKDAGTFSLALGYLAVLTTLFVGLDDILVRESARIREQTLPILMTYGVIRFALSIVAWLAMLLILTVLSLYTPNDLSVLTVITGCILIDAFSALGQSVLNAHNHFDGPLVAISVGAAVKLGGALFALLGHQSLMVLSWAWPLGSAFSAALLTGMLVRHLHNLRSLARFRFDPGWARQLVRLVPAFSATSILSGLEYQLDVVLLSVLLSNEAVAWYSAAVTIMMIVLTASQAYRMVLYPALVSALADRPAALRGLVGRSTLLMGGLALLAAAIIALIAPWLMNVLYAGRLAVAVPVLQVLIWNVVFLFLNVPLVRFLMASNGQSIVWRTLLVSLTVNVIANLLLIPRLGVMGSAYARLLSSGLFCALIGWQVYRRLARGHLDQVLRSQPTVAGKKSSAEFEPRAHSGE